MTGTDRGEAPIDITDDVRELLGSYLQARGADLSRLDRALAGGDFATIGAVGHAFHGSSATFGFPEAGRIGAELEAAAARGDGESVKALAARLRASFAGAVAPRA